MKVSDLILEAFGQAIQQHVELYKSWMDITILLGGKALPFSLLGLSVHDIGALDLVLRCMENETKAVIDKARINGSKVELPDGYWYQETLSRIWISEIYEVFRLLKKRNLVRENSTLDELANHLRLLRIPFDKHEIAKDRKLKEQVRGTSVLNTYGNPSRYDSDDPRKVYSLHSRDTARGSIEWKVLDLDTGQSVWLERLSLSERVLELFQDEKLIIPTASR